MKRYITQLPYGKKTQTKLYACWHLMKDRCNRVKSKNYVEYGGRGISVCPEWEVFSGFRSWAIATGFRKNLTIDRRDNDGNYEPSNCRWASRKEQANNRCSNVNITFNGKTLNQKQWAEHIGICKSSLQERIQKWGLEKALSTPKLR